MNFTFLDLSPSLSIALIVVVLTTAFLVFRYLPAASKVSYGVGNNRKTVLLMGPSGSGKTLLFCKWIHQHIPQTVPSMKESKGKYKGVEIVDLPGASRLRNLYENHLHSVRTIIFVLDSSSTALQRDLHNISEQIYDVLVNETVQKNYKNIKFIIFCNKQDEVLAHATGKIQEMLEHEMNALRNSKTSFQQLKHGQKPGVEERDLFLGIDGEAFKFEHIENDVVVLGGSVVQGSLEELEAAVLK
jgi:signal recognition particle receptor subunit beta